MTDSASNCKAVTVKRTFSRQTSISVHIHADKSIIWGLLTNASEYTRWNSTIISIQGTIVKGGKIHLKSALDPKRIFRLSIKEFDENHRLIWGDAMGKRVYLLTSIGNGETNFTMDEKIGGPLFPLFAKMIPSFDKSFEQFASDLKDKAESIMKSK